MNECELCGWKDGAVHTHHIIPMCENGKDTKENKIVICPNHHAEATKDFVKFNIKYNLIGERHTEKEIKMVNGLALFYYEMINSPNLKGFVINYKKQVRLFLKMMDKLKLDEHDLFACLMRVTKKSFENYNIAAIED